MNEHTFTSDVSSSFTSSRLHLILLPTEQCNFRCTYCYEDFSIGRMGADTITGVKRLIERRIDDLRDLAISWFGGEPLVARDIVEDISGHVYRLAATRPSLNYEADITTNAYTLTLPVCHRLCEVGVRHYQVSLDGPREFHDRTRIRSAGGPSFDRIWANLLAVRASPLDVSVVLRIHLSPSNVAVVPDFLSTIKSTFLTDSRFSVFLKCVEPLGGPHDSELDFISHADRSGILERLTNLLSEDCPDSSVTQPDVCYASKPNSLVIRPNGSVAKCTVALSDDANNVGCLDSDGRVRLDNVRLAPWFRGWQSGDPSVLSCPLDDFPTPTAWTQRESTKRNLIPLVDVSLRG